MIRSSVDLPDPLGPSSAVSDPSGTSSETSCRAVKSPNCLAMVSISMVIESLFLLGERAVITSSTSSEITASSVAAA